MPDLDAVILGAGPAGAAAAIHCAGAGLRVAIVEREGFPRHAPGESLHPGVQPLLRQLGVEGRVLAAGFLRHPGVVVEWAGPETVSDFGSDELGPWLGFQAWRADFDAILLDRARELGVRTLLPVKASGILTEPDGRVSGVETEGGPVNARFTVDCTGRWQALSRWRGIGWERVGPDRRAWFGYASGDCPARGLRPSIRADSGGWTWIARVRTSLYQWTRMNFDNTRPPEGWIPPELRGLEPVGPRCGHDVTWRAATRPAGPGYFLAGDAAAVLDPASSHGVLKALMSGILAGHMIDGMARHGVSPEVTIAQYTRVLGEWFRNDVAELITLYGRLDGDAGKLTIPGIPTLFREHSRPGFV